MKRLILAAWFLALAVANSAAQSAATNPLVTARVFSFDELTTKTAPNGSVGRNVFNGIWPPANPWPCMRPCSPAGPPPTQRTVSNTRK